MEKRKEEIIRKGEGKSFIDQYGQWYLKAESWEMVDGPDELYCDGLQTVAAINKLEQLVAQNKPFFFGVGYYRPHLPFNVPKKYWDLYDRTQIPLAKNPHPAEHVPLMALNNLRELREYRDFSHVRHPSEGSLSEEESRLLKHGYWASVSYADAQIGKLIKKLKELNVLEQTIIVFWGDNGYKLGEQGSWCKMTNYDVDTRVPLIISTPFLGGKGQFCNALVEWVDIYPTLCELSGLPLLKNLEGTSMVSLINDPKRPWKTAVFSQFLREGIWVAPDGVVYQGDAIRTDRYRLAKWWRVKDDKVVAYEMYDHQRDPLETNNLAEELRYKEILAELKRQLSLGWRHAVPRTH